MESLLCLRTLIKCRALNYEFQGFSKDRILQLKGNISKELQINLKNSPATFKKHCTFQILHIKPKD